MIVLLKRAIHAQVSGLRQASLARRHPMSGLLDWGWSVCEDGGPEPESDDE